MKKMFFSIIALIMGMAIGYAQAPVFVNPPSSIPADTTLRNANDTLKLRRNGNTVTGVSVSGDLVLLNTPVLTDTLISIIVRSKNIGRVATNDCTGYLTALGAQNFGFGKGVVNVGYGTATCGGYSLSLPLLKTFTQHPPIVGPSCLNLGDTVTYSVCPIITVNTGANIGFDSYKWDLSTEALLNSGLQLAYASGDSSSLTFKVTGAGPYFPLTCSFGNFNTATASSLALGVKTPVPTIYFNGISVKNTNTQCVGQGGGDSINLSITTATGYTYQWSTNNSSNWKFGTGRTSVSAILSTTAGNSTTLFVDQSMGDLYLTTYGGCSPRTDTIHINRTASKPLYISGLTSCLLSGGNTALLLADSATNSTNYGNQNFVWTVPTGWNISQNNSLSAIVAPAIGAISGKVVVKNSACPLDSIFATITVKPATPAAIIGATCITYGSTAALTDSVVPVAGATSYTWANTATGWTGSSTTNKIAYTPSGTSVGQVSVIANNAGCSSATSPVLTNAFSPVVADSIVASCLNYGLATAATFKVNTVTTGTIYTWTVPAALGSISGSNIGSLINVNVLANAPLLDTIKVVSSNAACPGNSVTKVLVLKDTSNGVVSLTELTGLSLVQVTGSKSGSTYQWYTPGGVALAGQTSSAYAMTNAATGGIYSVKVGYGACTTLLYTPTTKYGSFSASNPATKTTIASEDASIASLSNTTISPNPASNQVRLAFPAGMGLVNIKLVNVNGATVYTNSVSAATATINTSSFANGTYYVVLKDAAGESVTKNVVIAK